MLLAAQNDGDEDLEPDKAALKALPNLSLFTPPKDTNFKPEVGAWASYKLEDKISKSHHNITIAVTGQERVKHGMANWIEIATESSNETPIVAKFLWVPSKDEPSVLKMIVKAGSYAPVEVETHQKTHESHKHVEGEFEKIGKETVKIKGKSIITSTYKHKLSNGETVQLWTSSLIPPFGMVRSISLSHELILTDYGKNYVSQITQEPIQLNSTNHPNNLP